MALRSCAVKDAVKWPQAGWAHTEVRDKGGRLGKVCGERGERERGERRDGVAAASLDR